MTREHPPVPNGAGNSLRGLHAARSENRDPAGKPPKRKLSGLRVTLIAASVWVVLVGGILIAHWFSDLPNTSNLFAYEPGNDISVLDVKGRMIARRGLTQGESIKVGELPPYVGNAFIAVEDRRFRYHFGIDPQGLARAPYPDWVQASPVAGRAPVTAPV